MQITATRTPAISLTAARAGQVLSLLVGLFLLFDAVIHVLAIGPVLESFRDLGFADSAALPIGLVELACLVLHAVPRTAVLGAVLLTGYLGGAVAAHFRAESPLLSTTLFPFYVGVAIWAGLYLRDARARAIVGGNR